jgi:hypothetical protein
MSVTERQRHELHEWAKRVGDQEVAATLMELLPPVGWADVATKRDLDHLGSQLRAELRHELSAVRSELQVELAGVRSSMSSLEARMHRDLRVQLFGVIGSIWAALGVALTVLSR